MKEVYVAVNGYKGLYEVSNLGNVRSLTRVIEMKNGSTKTVKGRVLKLTTDQKGYQKVHLSANDQKTMVRVHQLVCTHFIDKPDLVNDYWVNRYDNDLSNNRVDNLYWELSSVSNANAGRKGGQISKKK